MDYFAVRQKWAQHCKPTIPPLKNGNEIKEMQVSKLIPDPLPQKLGEWDPSKVLISLPENSDTGSALKITALDALQVRATWSVTEKGNTQREPCIFILILTLPQLDTNYPVNHLTLSKLSNWTAEFVSNSTKKKKLAGYHWERYANSRVEHALMTLSIFLVEATKPLSR